MCVCEVSSKYEFGKGNTYRLLGRTRQPKHMPVAAHTCIGQIPAASYMSVTSRAGSEGG